MAQADIISRHLINSGIKHHDLYYIQAHVSRLAGRYDKALHYIQSVIDIIPSHLLAIKFREEVSRLNDQQPPSSNYMDSYLLIKTWGFGFWADVDHVLGQLLLAEITERTPVVYWSPSSLFSDGSSRNAFEIYFDPLSDISIDYLASHDFCFYPPKWSAKNLYLDNIQKFSGEYYPSTGS